MALEPEEQVTLVTASGAEYERGPKTGASMRRRRSRRLESFGLRGVLSANTTPGRYFVLLIERGREAAFDAYRVQESLEVVAWLDSTAALERCA